MSFHKQSQHHQAK